MQVSVKSSGIAHLIGAVAVLWLGTGTAWAGGGGPDAASIQLILDRLCTQLETSCPQLPTVTQLVLEFAGLENSSPDVVRFENGLSPTVAVNAVNPPAGSPLGFLSGELSNVSPLAFNNSSGAAVVTQPGNPATSFLYAATDGAAGTPPVTLHLVYDYPGLTPTSQPFAKGQFIADISLPLVVLKNGTESETPITIEIRGTGSVPIFSATAAGNFGGTDVKNLGVTVTLTFQSSPNLKASHAVFEVQAPLVVTQSNDLAYFNSNVTGGDPKYASDPFASFLPPAFVNDELGFPPKSFGGVPVGIGPYAAPMCTRVSCPPTKTTTSNFPLCATIADDQGIDRPAVAAFFSIGTTGTTYLSALVTPSSQVTCPF